MAGSLRSWLRARQPVVVPEARQYRRSFGRWPNVIRPKTFSEKLLYKKLYDRRPLLRIWSDKIAVRDYVRDRLGTDEYLVPLLGVYDTADDVAAAALPGRFVLKASHGSGWVKIFEPGTPRDVASIRALVAPWLACDYGVLWREWGYRGIPRRLLAEVYLEDEGRIASDFKFFCFNGVPRFLLATQDRFAGLRVSAFDMDWQELDLRQWDNPPVVDMRPPKTFARMAELARLLSADTDFVRVDFYEANGRVYFGELTTYHLSGQIPLEPRSWDSVLGNWWRVPWRYR